MIFNVKNTAGMGKKCAVYDAQGTKISSCFRYDTKTREVSMFLTGHHPKIKNKKVLTKRIRARKPYVMAWATLKVKVKIPGSYIVVDGVKY